MHVQRVASRVAVVGRCLLLLCCVNPGRGPCSCAAVVMPHGLHVNMAIAAFSCVYMQLLCFLIILILSLTLLIIFVEQLYMCSLCVYFRRACLSGSGGGGVARSISRTQDHRQGQVAGR